jgi:hypothetical protein
MASDAVCEHDSMSRTTMLVLVALGATLAGFALSSNARRLQDDSRADVLTPAASPQKITLGWKERHPKQGDEYLVFRVESLEVRRGGWEARIGLENHTSVPYLIGGTSALAGGYGLMLMSSGDDDELDRQNQNGTLPPPRKAVRFDPPLPLQLEPGTAWQGTISAPGALAAKSYVRVVFGPIAPADEPAPGLDSRAFSWITDHTVQLGP